jgi:hypothetical protein
LHRQPGGAQDRLRESSANCAIGPRKC